MGVENGLQRESRTRQCQNNLKHSKVGHGFDTHVASPTHLHPQKIGRDLWILFTLLVHVFVCTIVYLKHSARTADVLLPSHPAAANNGLKKKVLKYLPKLTYATNNDNISDCEICLAEFAVGDEL
ncbi:RING-H2 finger protein ATL8 [Forsythia ovata]|uniref:RING-H2 finger protein ATL8 n=1 Tax=Forsythia ovata TaxID=205694 RepID=A0ABD1XD22_9LAMI